jgi:hypothetical protein
MNRKLVILLSFIAVAALVTGCKDDAPTATQSDTSKAGYGSAQQQSRTPPPGAQSTAMPE